jgi:DNA-binding response OmpR family regulator
MSEPARILVLEDDSNMLESLCEALQTAGYEARGASRPELAVEMCKQIPFNLVISDIRMAGPTDGLGAIAAMKKYQPNLRVIMITGYASSDAPRRAIQLQVDDYVQKPFRLPVLLQAVDRVLNRPSGILAPLQGLRALLAAPLKLMSMGNAKRVQQLLQLLEQEKQKVLNGFFVAVRSRAITKSAALELWDQLEVLEERWLQLGQSPSEESLTSLGSAYRIVLERTTYFQKTGKVASSAPRPPGKVTRAGFSQLIDNLQAGQLGLEDIALLLESRVVQDQPVKLPLKLKEALQVLTV